MTYEPLTLTKHQDGHKYGTVHHGDKTYEVKVASRDGGRLIDILVVNRTGDLAGSIYMRAGMLRKRAIGLYTLKSANAQGHTQSEDRGYEKHGTIAQCAETVVHEYLNEREHARKEAAMTPEEKADEAARRDETISRSRNERIAKDAQALLDEMDQLIPTTTVHYAVEDARRALTTLVREASKHSIKTVKTESQVG
jgi:hypothetical protein